MSARVSFEFEVVAIDIKSARSQAVSYIATFLSIPESEVEDRVSIELKVGINTRDYSNDGLEYNYKVTVYGSLKNQFIFQ